MSIEENKKGFVVSEEAAENEFNEWVENMDLMLDEADMDQEELQGFKKIKARLVRTIRKGNLKTNDDGEFVFTPTNRNSTSHDAITFGERSGASIMAMDKRKKGHDAAKMYAIMADMCKTHPSKFAGMKGADSKVCEGIFTLLMD